MANDIKVPLNRNIVKVLDDKGTLGEYTIQCPINLLDTDKWLVEEKEGERVFNPRPIYDETDPTILLFDKGWYEVKDIADHTLTPDPDPEWAWVKVSEGGASDAIDLSPDGTTCESGKIRFAVDSEGNYGYIKAGADSVTPFKSGGEEMVINYTSLNGLFSGDKFAYMTKAPSIDTRNVTDMSFMFDGCNSITSVPLYDTQNVHNMSSMFSNCHSLTSVPKFDTSSVMDMIDMFNGCSSLTSVPKFDTSSVMDMSRMFFDCTSLTEVPELDTSNVMWMEYMFYDILDFRLSETSRNNILLMCANSAVTSDKRLSELFESISSVSWWNTLPAYDTFIAAGWTLT